MTFPSSRQGSTIVALPGTPPAIAPVEPGDMQDQADDKKYKTIWDKMHSSFQISDISRPEIDRWRNYFIQRPKLVTAIFEHSKPFIYYVAKEVSSRKLPMELALLPAIESGFKPFAYSSSHASGLWQFVPITASRFKLDNDKWMDLRRDLYASTGAALDYLTYLHNYFNGDWLLAIAAYNAGEGTVGKAIMRNMGLGRPTDFWDLNLPAETRDYVPRLLAISQIVQNPAEYGLSLPDIADKPMLASIPLKESLDLSVAAQLLNMPVNDLKRLNPGLKRMVTPPNREYKLAIPHDKMKDFTVALASLAGGNGNQQGWQQHVLAQGETLADVARRYGVDEEDLRRQNPRENGKYQPGDTLMIAQAPVRYPSTLLTTDKNGGNVPAGAPPVLASTAANTAPAHRISLASLLGNGTPRTARSLIADNEYTQSGHAGSRIRSVVVKAGETLYHIAQKANIPLADLRRWNKLREHDTIQPGQRLFLADAGGSLFSGISGDTTLSTNGKRARITYVVQLGDTLYSIARRFNVAFHQLLSWNKLGERLDLRPGDILTVYVNRKDGNGD